MTDNDPEGIEALAVRHDQNLEELCAAAFLRGRRRERADLIRKIERLNLPDCHRRTMLNALGSPKDLT